MGGSAAVPTISVPDMSGGGSTSGGSGVASAASGAAQIFNPSSNFVPSFGKTQSSIGFMEAAQLQRDSSIVINVNAPSVIDEEGFSRAVSSAMNNGYYRGTGGATNLIIK